MAGLSLGLVPGVRGGEARPWNGGLAFGSPIVSRKWVCRDRGGQPAPVHRLSSPHDQVQAWQTTPCAWLSLAGAPPVARALMLECQGPCTGPTIPS